MLVQCQHTSVATQGVTGKFQRSFEGPYYISNMANPNLCELQDENGKPRGLFHLQHLKPYSMPLE